MAGARSLRKSNLQLGGHRRWRHARHALSMTDDPARHGSLPSHDHRSRTWESAHDISGHFETFHANHCCPLVRGQTQRYGSVCDPVDVVRPSHDRVPAAQPPAGSESAGPWKPFKGPTCEPATDTSAIITWTTTIGGRAVEAHPPRHLG